MVLVLTGSVLGGFAWVEAPWSLVRTSSSGMGDLLGDDMTDIGTVKRL